MAHQGVAALVPTVVIAFLLAACAGTDPDPGEPAAAPTATGSTPGPTDGPPEPGDRTVTDDPLAEVERLVEEALGERDFEGAAELMANPHQLGYFQSEGQSLPPSDAAIEYAESYSSPDCVIEFPASPADIAERLDGTDPLGMWDPRVDVVSAVYSAGWGTTCDGEAFLVFSQEDDGTVHWYGTLLAPQGF